MSIFTKPRWLYSKFYRWSDEQMRGLEKAASAGLARCDSEDPRGLNVEVMDRRKFYREYLEECQKELDYRNQYDKSAENMDGLPKAAG